VCRPVRPEVKKIRPAPPMARERACSTIPKVVAFASRSFSCDFTVIKVVKLVPTLLLLRARVLDVSAAGLLAPCLPGRATTEMRCA